MARKQEVAHESHDGWTDLMVQYGNAMLRIGKLEQEIQALREALQEAANQPVGHAGLLEQLEERSCAVSRQAETIIALRLQIDSLGIQLDQLRGLPDHANGTNHSRPRRRHRRHRRHWWELWHPHRHALSSNSSDSSAESPQVEQTGS